MLPLTPYAQKLRHLTLKEYPMGIIYPLHGCVDVFSPPLTTSEDRIDFRYVLPIDLQVQSYFNLL